MKLDMHFHVVGRGAEINQVDENVYFYPDDNNLFFTTNPLWSGGEGFGKAGSGCGPERVGRYRTST